MKPTFEWDEGKARSNVQKHGVSFEEAAMAFGDPPSLTIPSTLPRRVDSFSWARRIGIGWWLWSTPNGTIISVSSALTWRRGQKGELMKANEDDMRVEYDFTKGVRGKYADRFAEGSNVVVLDPNVAHVFLDSASVNRALRALAEIAENRPRREMADRVVRSNNANGADRAPARCLIAGVRRLTQHHGGRSANED